jgi:hypothetical protein
MDGHSTRRPMVDLDSIGGAGMNNEPKWNVAIVDGEPVQVINAAAVRELVKMSPYGEERAKEILKQMLPAELYDKVFSGE